jgi:uncharacterized damage-inducible protein DinB
MATSRETWLEELRIVHAGDAEGEAFHGPATRRILEGVTAEAAARRPIPQGHTIREIVEHVLAWREIVCEWMEGGTRRMRDEEDWAPVRATPPAAWHDLLARLEANQARLLRLVGELPEERLARSASHLRFLLHHELHHMGQVALLKRG